MNWFVTKKKGLPLCRKTQMFVKFWDGYVGPQIILLADVGWLEWVLGIYTPDHLCSTLTRLLGSHKMSFEAISILNNLLLLCCFPGWKQNLKPPWVFPASKSNFSVVKLHKLKLNPFFFSVKTPPGLLRFCFYFLVTWLCVENWEATWNLKSLENWSRKNSHRVYVDLFSVREVFLTHFKLL